MTLCLSSLAPHRIVTSWVREKLQRSVTKYKKILTKTKFHIGDKMHAHYLSGCVICERFMTGMALWNVSKKARSSMSVHGIFIQQGRRVWLYQGCCDLIKIGNIGWKQSKRSGMILFSRAYQLILDWSLPIHQLTVFVAILHISYFAKKYLLWNQQALYPQSTAVHDMMPFFRLRRFCRSPCQLGTLLKVFQHGDNVPTGNARSQLVADPFLMKWQPMSHSSLQSFWTFSQSMMTKMTLAPLWQLEFICAQNSCHRPQQPLRSCQRPLSKKVTNTGMRTRQIQKVILSVRMWTGISLSSSLFMLLLQKDKSTKSTSTLHVAILLALLALIVNNWVQRIICHIHHKISKHVGCMHSWLNTVTMYLEHPAWLLCFLMWSSTHRHHRGRWIESDAPSMFRRSCRDTRCWGSWMSFSMPNMCKIPVWYGTMVSWSIKINGYTSDFITVTTWVLHCLHRWCPWEVCRRDAWHVFCRWE